MSTPVAPVPVEHRKSLGVNLRLFVLILLALVGGAIVRSAIATRLDGFTIDEAYHIAAGVSYVRYADFRINPEHPPLVKLWVGSFISATGFHLSNIRPFADKADERDFAEEDVYFNNDFNSVQRRARIAMLTLSGLLLLALAFAVRRAFGTSVALGTLLFLAIDPTVAAHLPVVMTDLPVSLLCATAVVLAIRAFQEWAWSDLVACSVALGLGLATKHSAPVFFIFVILAGVVLALVPPVSRLENSRFFRFAKLLAVAAGAVILLWGFYFFRFAESNTGRELFNRPLADKIADVHSPVYRFVLKAMASSHVVPRAYIWGFADTIRAGLEGRADPITAFGRPYVKTAPKYFFPGVVALKLPIGLDVLVLIGLFLFFARRLPPERNAGLVTVLAASILFFLVLALGSTYAGVRHALLVIALLAIFGGLAVQLAFSSNSKPLKGVVVAALVAAAASALPVMRPWEYFNEIIGGTKNGYLYFSDEGVDLWQRGKELDAYYHRVLEPAGEVPLLAYGIFEPEEKARHLDWLGRDKNRDDAVAPVGTLNVQTKECDVATPNPRPHDPAPAPDGSLWHTAQAANKLGRTHWVKAFHVKSEIPPTIFLPVQSKNAKDLGAGKLLVASRNLADPNFAETVVLLVHYDAEGVVGLILNRRTAVPLSRVLAGLRAAKERSDPVYLGGPVETPAVLALLKSPAKLEGAKHIFGGVYLISTKALFEQTISARPDPGVFHVYLGYAGWTNDQLRKEVELGAWFIFQADAGTVFNSNPDSLWPQMIQKTELKLAGSEPADPDQRTGICRGARHQRCSQCNDVSGTASATTISSEKQSA